MRALSRILWVGLAVAADPATRRAAPPARMTWQPGNLQPLVVGWQQFFRVQWDATPAGRPDARRGVHHQRVGVHRPECSSLLVTGYDASGSRSGNSSPGAPARSTTAPGSTSTCPCPRRPATTSRSSPGPGCRRAMAATCARLSSARRAGRARYDGVMSRARMLDGAIQRRLIAVVAVAVWLAAILAGCATMSAPRRPGSPGTFSPSSSAGSSTSGSSGRRRPEGGGTLDRRVHHQHVGLPRPAGARARHRIRRGRASRWGNVIAWGPNEINPGGRVYFDVTVPGGAASYDVSIFSWNWVQVGLNLDAPIGAESHGGIQGSARRARYLAGAVRLVSTWPPGWPRASGPI